MYIPQSFREDRIEELYALIRSHSFATLVTLHEGELFASHLPFLLDTQRGSSGALLGHLARANPQWRSFTGRAEALVIFQGPHTYVSPAWYQEPKSVPTWNYLAVHAYGKPRIISQPEEVRALLANMVSNYEPTVGESWDLDRLPADFLEKMMEAIAAFEIPILRLEGKWKLGQNRSPADRESVVAALGQRGAFFEEIALRMEETLPEL